MARDLREETKFNPQEWALFRQGADAAGLTKGSFLRFAALQVAEKYAREDHAREAEERSE